MNLISIVGEKPTHLPIGLYQTHFSDDSGVFNPSPLASGNRNGIKAGPAANRNRSLKFFAEHKEYTSILIIDQSVKVLRQGILEKLESAIKETKQPFIAVGHNTLPLAAASSLVVYHNDVNQCGIYLTREAFDKVGYFNNIPRFHTLYFQRLMRAFGFSPEYLPSFRYTSYYLETPEYKETVDTRFDKLATEIWNGYGLEEWNAQLPKKGEY